MPPAKKRQLLVFNLSPFLCKDKGDGDEADFV